MKKLFIFDCDGVLVDSEFITSKIFSESLCSYGYSISVEECIRRFTGVNELTCRDLIMRESKVTIPVDYWDIQHPNLMKAYETLLKPLVQPVLEWLNVLNIPRCVASNSSLNHIMRCLKMTQQECYFIEKNIFSAQQVSNPKPDPDLFLFAAKNMEIAPEDCIVIEDSIAGVDAALAAGMQVLLFLGGTHAHFSWYRDKFASYNKPLFLNSEELLEAIIHETK